jgi:hypothetical protein
LVNLAIEEFSKLIHDKIDEDFSKNLSLIKIKGIIRPRRPNRGRVIKEDPHRINERIRVPEVRVVGEGIEQGVYPTSKAIKMAEEMDLI